MLRAHIPPTPAVLAESKRIARENLQRHEPPDEYDANRRLLPPHPWEKDYDRALARQIERQHQTGVTL